MPFKKLNQFLLDKIAELGLEEPTPLQKELIPKIKSGANIFAVGEKGSGKTEALIISVLQKLQMKPKTIKIYTITTTTITTHATETVTKTITNTFNRFPCLKLKVGYRFIFLYFQGWST